MGAAKNEAIEKNHAHAAAVDLVEAAFRQKKLGPRQYKAMVKHAAKQTPEHIASMLTLMEHKTMRAAHKAVIEATHEGRPQANRPPTIPHTPSPI